LADKARLNHFEEKERLVKDVTDFLTEVSVGPDDVNSFLESVNTNSIKQKVKAITIASRPQVGIGDLLSIINGGPELEAFKSDRFWEIEESAEIKIKYEGYILREKIVADKIKRLENLKIPDDIVYDELVSISTEGRQKLNKIKPANIGHAGRISGVSPSDVNILLMYLGR